MSNDARSRTTVIDGFTVRILRIAGGTMTGRIEKYTCSSPIQFVVNRNFIQGRLGEKIPVPAETLQRIVVWAECYGLNVEHPAFD